MSEIIPCETQEENTNTKTEFLSIIISCVLCKQNFYSNEKHECSVKDNEKIVRIR